MTSPDLLRRLHQGMLRLRIVEERIAELYAEQQMRCPVHLCVGQEAVATGVCAALEAPDFAVSTHRSHGHYVAKGGDLRAMMAEIYGKATGCSGGRGGSMHLVDLLKGFLGSTPIVGSTIPIGVGSAFASALKGEKRVTAVFFGEGATEEGTFHEAANFAVLKKLPAVFVCENNLYSVYSPMEVRQPAGREVADLARGHGLEAHQADGNDAVAVHTLAERAVRKARDGGGPTFLEFKTYRWREHCGPMFDNDIGYRTPAEYEAWKVRCPVRRSEERLLAEKAATRAELDGWAAASLAEINDAVAFAKASPWPDPATLLDGVTA